MWMIPFASAIVTLTISKSEIFAPLRGWMKDKDPKVFGKLFSCPYCLSHWVALCLCIYEGEFGMVKIFASVAFTAPIMALVSWSMFIVGVYAGGEEDEGD